MNILRSACVYVRDDYAGMLCETDEGYCFTYDAAYLARPDTRAVSLTLPKQEESHTSKSLFPFFDGLIPEGWLLNLISRNWKIDKSDRFGILCVACRDAIGAVSVRETQP